MVDIMESKSADLVNYEQYIKHIKQLNPFDAIVFLKKETNQEYNVQMVNSKAVILFQTMEQKKVNAEEYFTNHYWNQLKPMLESPNGDIRLIQFEQLKNEKQAFLAVYVLLIEINNEVFFSVIFRHSSKNKLIMQEESSEIAKHLFFVEQYVHPVLSIDMNGTIIHTNIAATTKIIEKNQFILGRNMKDLIADYHKEEFNLLFKRTLEGVSVGMPKCDFKEHFKADEAFYLKLLPTYWEGTIIGVHIIMKDVESYLKDSESFYYLSLRDELTGLWNRSALKEHWRDEFKELVINKSKIAFLLIDLDRFKKFNESLGEEKGDELITTFCSRLESICHEECRLYRYSGDEFIFIIKNHTREDIEQFATSILDVLKVPFIVDGQEYFVTVSIGIALSPTDGSDLESLMRKADQALFHVKEHGRSHFKFYRDEMGHAFPDEALMEAHLRRAIEFNELSIHLQPQIDLVTKRIDSFEALLRWNNRKFGFVTPAQFIPIAEASGIIIEIGDWVIEQVCRYQQEWRKLGYRPVRIAVNISPKQFRQDNFARKIEALLKKYDVDPNYLEVEITEGSMTNINETLSMLTELKSLGIYVSVDDFGTGYSSLSYLKRYPIDIIKIDQSFIADIKKDIKNEAIIKSIILLSHSLGLEVVAEGVEEQFQEDFLKEFSCQKVQGFYYNKPLPVEEMVKQYLIN